MVLVYYVVNLMVPQDHYFIEMSTLLNLFQIKGWFTESDCHPATGHQFSSYFFTQQWPDPLSAGAYQFEIISTGLRNLTMPHQERLRLS